MKAAVEALHETQEDLREAARLALHGIVDQLRHFATAIEKLETRTVAGHRTNDVSRRLATIPGIGPITASAIAAAVPDGSLFRSARRFAAWLGLTSKAHSNGGKERQVGTVLHGSAGGRSLAISPRRYGRRTYSGRPSSRIRFSAFTAIAISVRAVAGGAAAS